MIFHFTERFVTDRFVLFKFLTLLLILLGFLRLRRGAVTGHFSPLLLLLLLLLLLRLGLHLVVALLTTALPGWLLMMHW